MVFHQVPWLHTTVTTVVSACVFGFLFSLLQVQGCRPPPQFNFVYVTTAVCSGQPSMLPSRPIGVETWALVYGPL